MPIFVPMKFPNKLQSKITLRQENNALRSLGASTSLIDFSSNDYLGFAKSEIIFDASHQFLIDNNYKINGATGSRLLSGNYFLYDDVEKQIAEFHQSESALIFNSGYDANVGFFSSVPQRGDVILYDEFIHASIRDGIQLSNAKAYKFKHNDVEDLRCLLERSREVSSKESEIYVVTESVFSMDGDTPDLVKMSQIIQKHSMLILWWMKHMQLVFLGSTDVDEIQRFGIEKTVFATNCNFWKRIGLSWRSYFRKSRIDKLFSQFCTKFYVYNRIISARIGNN